MKTIDEKNIAEEQNEEEKGTRKNRFDELKEIVNRLAEEMYREEDIGKSRDLRSEIIRIMNSSIWEKGEQETEEKDETEKSEADSDEDDEDYGMGDKVLYLEVEDGTENLNENDEGEGETEKEENSPYDDESDDDIITEQFLKNEIKTYGEYLICSAAKWLAKNGRYREPWVQDVFENTLNETFDSYNPEYKSDKVTAKSFYNWFFKNLKYSLTEQNVIYNEGRLVRIIRRTPAYKYDKEKDNFKPNEYEKGEKKGQIKQISKSKKNEDVYQVLSRRGGFLKIAKTYQRRNKYDQPVKFEEIFLKNGNIKIIQSDTKMYSFNGNKPVIMYLKEGIYNVVWMLKNNGRWWYILKDQKGWVEADRCQYNGNVIYMGEPIKNFIKPGKEYTVTYDKKNPEKEMKGEMIIDLLHDPSGLWEDKWVSAEDITIDKGKTIVIDENAENFQIGDIVEVTDQIYRDGIYYYTVVTDDGTKSEVRADQVEFIEGKLFIEKNDVMLYAPAEKSGILGKGERIHKSLGEYTINGKKVIGEQLYYSAHNRKNTRSFESYWVKEEDTQEVERKGTSPEEGYFQTEDISKQEFQAKIKEAMFSLISLIQQYEERKDTTAMYKTYMKLFYTDHLFYLLRGDRENSRIRKSTEKNSLRSMDQRWANHVLENPDCSSFQGIRSASAKRYVDFLSKGDRYESYRRKHNLLKFPVARIREKSGKVDVEVRNAAGTEDNAIVEIGELIYEIYCIKTEEGWDSRKYHTILNEFLENYYEEVENIIWNGKRYISAQKRSRNSK